MKINVKFCSLKDNTKLNLKKLGEFFENNQDFCIYIDNAQPLNEKIITFIEEMLHFIIRILVLLKNKQISVKKEHILIRNIITLLWSEFNNGKK